MAPSDLCNTEADSSWIGNVAMLGPPRRLNEPIAVSLEDLVPIDNFYRRVEAKLDLSFVRDWAREFFAEHGWPSMDRVVVLLQLVMLSEDIGASHPAPDGWGGGDLADVGLDLR
jgi:hypothetical protein